MRFYTTQHQFYCGIDLQARAMARLHPGPTGGERLAPPSAGQPRRFLKAIAPDRDELVIAVEGLFTWDLAGRPLCPGRHPACSRPCPLYEGGPWRQGRERLIPAR